MFKKLLRSFRSAVKGVVYCVKNERNMRLHLSAACFVLYFSTFFGLSCVKYLILLLTIASVLTLEMINSALEFLLDIVIKNYDSGIKIVKDISAGAVFLSAGASVFVGVALFSDLSVYPKIFDFFLQNVLALLTLIVALILDFFFIFIGPVEIKHWLKKIF